MDSSQIKEQLKIWIKYETNAEIFYLLWSEKQTELEDLFTSSISTLKKDKKKADFFNWGKQFFKTLSTSTSKRQNTTNQHFKDEEAQALQNQEEGCYQNSQSSILSQFQEKYSLILEKNSQKGKKSSQQVLSILYQQIKVLFSQFTFKIYKQSKHRYQNKSEQGKYQKLKYLIQQFLQIQQKNPQNIIVEKIIKYRTTEVLRSHQYFIDKTFRQKFKKILELSRSFIYIKQNGNDIDQIAARTSLELQQCFIKLSLTPILFSEIKKQILANPLSNCVASHKQLTQSQKSAYYRSSFYNSRLLVDYIQAKTYAESIHKKAIFDISGLIQDLAANDCLINNQLIKSIQQFNFIGVLMNIDTRKKKTIYKMIRQKYQHFYKAFQLIHYLERPENTLKTDEKNIKKMNLRKVFFNVGLRFQNWQETEQNLLAKRQNFIDKLQLTRENKHQIRMFYQKELQTYFHQQEKILTFRQEIQQSLLKDIIINTRKLGNQEIQILVGYVKEIIQKLAIEGTAIENDLSHSDKIELTEILNKNQKFQEYKRNKGFDKSEEEYQAQQTLKRLINQINLKNQIEVSYQAVIELITQISKKQYCIPRKYHKYVCDLEDLRTQFKSAGFESIILEQQITDNEEFIQKQKEEESLVLITVTPDIQSQTKNETQKLKSANNSPSMSKSQRKIPENIKLNQSFEEKLQIQSNQSKESPLKSSKNSFEKSTPKIEESPLQSSKQSSTSQKLVPKVHGNKSIQQQLNDLYSQFYDQVKIQPKSTIINIINKNFKENPSVFIEEILKANPFENPQTSKIYQEFKSKDKNWITGLQQKPLKSQIISIADTFGKRCAQRYFELKSST